MTGVFVCLRCGSWELGSLEVQSALKANRQRPLISRTQPVRFLACWRRTRVIAAVASPLGVSGFAAQTVSDAESSACDGLGLPERSPASFDPEREVAAALRCETSGPVEMGTALFVEAALTAAGLEELPVEWERFRQWAPVWMASGALVAS